MSALWICDVNGVLVDTAAIVRGAFAATAPRFGFAFQERDFEAVKTLGLEDAYLKLDSRHDASRLRQFHVQHVRGHLGEASAYPGVHETLAAARARDIAVAAATSYGEIAEACLVGTGLYPYIDCLVTQEEVKRRKPHPDMILRILELFEVVTNGDRESVVYVGDTPADIEAGKRAGVLTVGVTYGLSSEQEIRTAGPDYVIHSFNDMRMFLAAPVCSL